MPFNETDQYASTDVPVIDAIRKRWSTRAFSPQPVEDQKLRQIFEAARWAASSFNEQPWRFIVGKKGDATYDKLFDALMEWNQGWNANTPVLGVAVAKKTFSDHTPSAGKDNFHHVHDLGQAMAYLVLQATELGIYSHQMAGFDWQQVAKDFDLDDVYHPTTMFALGYRDKTDSLPESYRDDEQTERTRFRYSRPRVYGRVGESSF